MTMATAGAAAFFVSAVSAAVAMVSTSPGAIARRLAMMIEILIIFYMALPAISGFFHIFVIDAVIIINSFKRDHYED